MSTVNAAAGPAARPFKCLVADDSEFARRNIGGIVQKIGGSVVGEATNGLEAIELYGQLHPDLVLLDITMPVLDGVETLRKIMEKDKDAKVVVVSALGHKEMVWKAICLGAKSFVSKPFSAEYAAMVIREALSGGGGGAPCATSI